MPPVARRSSSSETAPTQIGNTIAIGSRKPMLTSITRALTIPSTANHRGRARARMADRGRDQHERRRHLDREAIEDGLRERAGHRDQLCVACRAVRREHQRGRAGRGGARGEQHRREEEARRQEHGGEELVLRPSDPAPHDGEEPQERDASERDQVGRKEDPVTGRGRTSAGRPNPRPAANRAARPGQ